MNKNKYFEKQVSYWGKYFGLPDLVVKPDKRITKYAAYCYRQQMEIRYSPKHIPDYSKNGLIGLALHEIGHIKTNAGYYRGWEREYLAQKFALNNIRKHLPSYYKEAVADTKWYVVEYSKTNEKWQRMYIKGYGKLLKEI